MAETTYTATISLHLSDEDDPELIARAVRSLIGRLLQGPASIQVDTDDEGCVSLDHFGGAS